MTYFPKDDGQRIPDDLWDAMRVHLPCSPVSVHPLGCHRPRLCDRLVMDAVLFVLRNGCYWNALSLLDLCSSSSAHRRFIEWKRLGFFHRLREVGLLEHGFLKLIDWRWIESESVPVRTPVRRWRMQVSRAVSQSAAPYCQAERTLRVAIYYGSSSGNTERIARMLAGMLHRYRPAVRDVARDGLIDAGRYDLLFLGIPTWNEGQCQPDWWAVWPGLAQLDLSRSRVALFGPGDQFGYPDTYCNAMGMMHALLSQRQVRCLGQWPAAGYRGGSALALCQDGTHFVGLALDEEAQGDQTHRRLQTWVRQVLAECRQLDGGEA